MKKSSKKFAVSTEKKNDKGFRVKTAGIDITDYKLNPIMLMMHQRPTGKSRDEVGVIGNFVDLSFEKDALYGVPVFDDTDDYAMRQYNKYENGTMRMVSAGLIPLKWGKDEKGDVWLLKSKLFEISIADKGSNIDSLPVALYTGNGTDLITLSSINEIIENFNPNTNMKIIKLSAGAVALGLSATLETEEAVTIAMEKLVELTATNQQKLVQLTADLSAAKEAKKTAEDALEASVKLATETENKNFVELSAKNGKFVKGDVPKYIALMTKAPEETKALIEAMPANPSVLEQLKGGDGNDNALIKLSYDELDKSGQLETLKADNLPVFKAKFKAKFKKDYIG